MTRNWDKHLGIIIATLQDDETIDDQDRAIQAVLIALYKAVRGQIDLTDLAIACIEFDREHATTEVSR